MFVSGENHQVREYSTILDSEPVYAGPSPPGTLGELTDQQVKAMPMGTSRMSTMSMTTLLFHPGGAWVVSIVAKFRYQSTYCTYGQTKRNFIKIHYFQVLTSPVPAQAVGRT